MSGANKYTVHTRLAMLENAVTELKKENAELRTHLWTALETKANDLKNVIQDSIRIPQDGAPGKDGRDGVNGQSIVGPKGEAGDVLVIPESEMAKAVTKLRIELKEKHAAHIAVLLESITFHEKSDYWLYQHWAKLLQGIKTQIERLR
jgi:hypothetical protein